jgi:hypothetical protein
LPAVTGQILDGHAPTPVIISFLANPVRLLLIPVRARLNFMTNLIVSVSYLALKGIFFLFYMSDSPSLLTQVNEMWQKVPEEERRDVLLRAQSKATEACIILTIIGCTAGLSLHAPWIILCVVILLPVLFQVVSLQVWLDLKPDIVVRYFAASLASQRYASAVHARDTSLKLIFRGSLEQIPLDNAGQNVEAELFAEEVALESAPAREVWISLFPDSLVMIAEGDSGATLEFAHSTLENFAVALDSGEDSASPSPTNRLLIQTGNDEQVTGRWVLTSPHQSTLAACERKIRFFNHRAAQAAADSLYQ